MGGRFARMRSRSPKEAKTIIEARSWRPVGHHKTIIEARSWRPVGHRKTIIEARSWRPVGHRKTIIEARSWRPVGHREDLASILREVGRHCRFLSRAVAQFTLQF